MQSPVAKAAGIAIPDQGERRMGLPLDDAAVTEPAWVIDPAA